MGQQKKNTSCLGSLIYISLLLFALGALVTLSFYGIIIVGAIFLIIYFYKFITFAIKKIYLYVKRKYNERIQSGKPTFIRKLLDILNMNNWGKKIQVENDKTEEILCDISTLAGTIAVTEKIKNNCNIQELYPKNVVEKETIRKNTKDISSTDNQKAEIAENIHSVEERVVEEAEEAKQAPSKRKIKRKHAYMNKYDIEQFAKECNAYVVHEERKAQQALEWETQYTEETL